MAKPSDRAIAQFVDKAAQIISGAPFPSRRSLAKARELFDLVYATWLLPGIDAAAPEGAQAVSAWCEPDNPNNSSAFAWPGSARESRHSMPLYASPQPHDAEDAARLLDIYNRIPHLPVTAETCAQATDALTTFCMAFGTAIDAAISASQGGGGGS